MSIGQQSDIELPSDAPKTLLVSKHIAFIERYAAIPEEDYEYCATEHQRMSAVYWSLTALDLVYALQRSSADEIYPPGSARSSIKRDEVLAFIASCFREDDGGFAPAPLHDSHILSTLCAVQLLVLLDALDEAHGWSSGRLDRVARFVGSLQRRDGSFGGDRWGEADTRYSLCALGTLVLIGRLDAQFADLNGARDYLFSCLNFDSAFGCVPGAESHAAYVYCAVASLALLDALPLLDNAFERGLRAAVEAHNKPKTGNKMQTSETDTLTGAGTPTGSAAPTSQENTAPETSEKRPLRVEDYLYVSGVRDRLAWWLAERQLQSGGLNGRPEKLPDVCYSWWVLASLAILGRLEWIDADALADFILAAQDPGDAPAAAEAGSSQAAAASTTAPENKGSLSATATSTTAAAAAQDSTTPFPSTDSIATFATGAKPADATAAASPSIASAATTNVDSSAGGGGGISDRPGDMADPFHTVFGLAGLSLLAHTPRRHSSVDRGPSGQERWVALADSLRIVDPVLCMPRDSLERRGIHIKLLSSH